MGLCLSEEIQIFCPRAGTLVSSWYPVFVVSCMPKHFTESCRIAEGYHLHFTLKWFIFKIFSRVHIISQLLVCHDLTMMRFSHWLAPGTHADYTPLPPRIFWHIQGNGELEKRKDDDLLSPEFLTVVRQDYFA